jgi:prenylcysteine oxidase/farnesylcysteine lyase
MPTRMPRIAVIGAGVAGCAAAYFLRQEFPSGLEITVFERETSMGGRILTRMFAGSKVEFGAAFIHSTNQLLNTLIDSLQLKRLPSIHTTNAKFALGIWDGARFVLHLPASSLLKYPKLAFHYGLSLAKLRRSVENVLGQWSQIYDPQRETRVFASPKDMFESVGLLRATKETVDVYLDREHVSSPVRKELCCPIVRAIFNQNLGVNAFAGVVAMVASGVAGGSAFSVLGGNERLCQELLNKSGAQLFTGRGIKAVYSTSGGCNTVVDDRDTSSTFDAVIISAPLDGSRIALNISTPLASLSTSQEWQSVTETCVAGKLSAAFFGLNSRSNVPDLVLTTAESETPFSAITPVAMEASAPDSARSIYKIASVRPLEDCLLNELFQSIDDISSVTWRAYPRMEPRVDSIPFRLTRGIYYINSIEDIVSTLETQLLASRNAIRLMLQDVSFTR